MANDELKKSLDDLKRNIHIIKTYSQFKNRERLTDRTKQILAPEFKEYFYDLIDDKWDFYINPSEFYTHIELKRELKKDNIEEQIQNLIETMIEIRERLKDEGFNSKFLIYLDGKAQQEQNPDSFLVPLYMFTGFGTGNYLKYYKNGKYSSDEYCFCKIEYILI